MRFRGGRPLQVAALAAALAALAAAGRVDAAPANPRERQQETQSQAREPDLFAQGMELVKSERYDEARKLFERLHRDKPDDPEVLNMLAYTQRKTGKLDEALGNYHRALELRPDFPQAREYLGEAYLQAALREVEKLRGAGDAGREELQKLVDAFQQAAAQLESGSEGTTSSKKW